MKELRIGVIGNVDSGKSTLIGVITKNVLDNGRGSARQTILKHPHEKKSGRTSSISQNFLKLNNDDCINFIDLAGHEKYLKTTIKGLSGYFLDYVIIVVGANMGVSRMTKEHLSITIALKIPYIIVVTKYDISPKNIYDQTIKDIGKIINNRDNKKLKPFFLPNKINKKHDFNVKTYYPIVSVSNKTGKNINRLLNFLIQLEPKHRTSNIPHNISNNINEFAIDSKYNVKGVGIVLSGRCTYGKLEKNERYYIGPSKGMWLEVTLKSFHNNFREEIEYLNKGESGCVAIKFINAKKDDISNFEIKSGLILTQTIKNKSIKKFSANIIVLNNHSTTIKTDYEPIINCKRIAQCAKILNIDNNKIIRGGDKARIEFEFVYKPEYIQQNDYFIFREGRTRGIGIVLHTQE